MNILKNSIKMHTKSGVFQTMYDLAPENLSRGQDYVVKNCTEQKSKKNYTVKMIDMTQYDGDHKKRGQLEIQIMNLCKNHANILKLLSIFETPSHLMILTEECPKTNLNDFINQFGNLDKLKITTIMTQLLSAVSHIHSKDVVHRNIKLETVFVDNKLNLKLVDFSNASIVNNNTELKEATGSLNYMAPELIKLILGRSEVGYGKPVDIWACGIILAYLITGNFLFWDESISRMMQSISIVYINFNQPVWKNVNPKIKDLLEKLLRGEWDRRITASDALSHSLLKNKKPVKMDAKQRFRIIGMLVMSVFIMKKKARSYDKLNKVIKAVHVKRKRSYNIELIRKANDRVAMELYGHWTGAYNKQKRVMLFQNSQKYITSRVKKALRMHS